MPGTKLLFLSFFIFSIGFSQVPEYLQKLDTVVAYIGEPNMVTSDGRNYYMVDQNYVSKEMYDRYMAAKSAREACTPCFLMEYDHRGKLRNESISYQECYLTELKSYSAEGRLLSKGVYKVPSKEDLIDMKNCPLAEGTVSFYDENGKVKYTEKWKEGLFVSQKPEQDLVQAWRSQIYLNGNPIYTLQNIDISAFKDLKVKQEFKSKNRPVQTEVEFVVVPIGYNVLVFRENADNLQNVNFSGKLNIGQIPANKIAYVQLRIISDDQLIESFTVTTRGTLSAADYFSDFKSYAAIGDKENAEWNIGNAIKLDPENIEYLQAMGQFYYETKEYSKAQSALEKAIFVKRNYFSYHYLALTMYALDDPEKAISLNLKSIEFTDDQSNLAAAYQNMGMIKSKYMNSEGAYLDYKKSLEYNPDNLAVLNNISVVCDKIGRGSEAMKYLERIIEIDTSFYPAHINIGFKYLSAGNFEQANAKFDYVLKRDPNQAYAWSNKAFCELKMGKVDQSLISVNKSLALDPSNSYSYKNRALILFQLKRNKEACEDLNTAISLGFTKDYGNEVEELKREKCK